MIRRIGILGGLLIVFSVSFLGMTAFCDWLCWHTNYYAQAARENAVMED